MVSLGPVQITFLINTPFNVISSLHVPSGRVGFTYTNGSWCIVTIYNRWDRKLFIAVRAGSGLIPRGFGKTPADPLNSTDENSLTMNAKMADTDERFFAGLQQINKRNLIFL